MAEMQRAINQVNLGAPNISSGSAYHPGVAEDFRFASQALSALDQQIMQAEWRRQASEQYSKDVMQYSSELQELRLKVTDPAQFQVANENLAKKYLYENDKELRKTMHPRAMAMYKESVQPYIMQSFQKGQEDAFRARANNAVSGLLNAIDVNIADAAAQGIDGINLKDHVKRMEDNIGALPDLYVDKEKVRQEKRQHLFRALGEAYARDKPMETLEIISTNKDGQTPKFVLKLPLVDKDGNLNSLEDDILRMDPLMNQHLYTLALQSLDRQNTIASHQRTQSEHLHKVDSELQFGKAMSRIIAGERGVTAEINQRMTAFRSVFPGARPALDGGQINQLREVEEAVQKKQAAGEPTTKQGYAKAIDRIYRGNPTFDEVANMKDVSADDAISLMGKLASEKQRMKDESYTHYKSMRNEAEDTIRALVLAKNPMAAFGEINPVAEMLVAKFRNIMDEKETNLQAAKAGAGAWRSVEMNPKSIAMDLLQEQEPALKKQFEHDAEKLIGTLIQYMPSDGMSYKGMGDKIRASKEPEATKKMMMALLFQANAQRIPESQFNAAIKQGIVPGKGKQDARRETFLEWFRGLFGTRQEKQ